MLDAGGLAEPAREGDAELRPSEVAGTERAVGKIEHRREVGVDAGAAKR